MRPTPLLGVLGRPVGHSLSPVMFAAGFRHLAMDGRYLRIQAPDAGAALALARDLGLTGFNVTAPFKQDLAKLVDRLDPTARRLAAVNTVVASPDGWTGFNTDPEGVKGALRAVGLGRDLGPALVLGTGGAARAAGLALAELAAEVTILGRARAAAEELAALCRGRAGGLDQLGRLLAGARVLVSCLPPGVDPLAGLKLRPDLVVLDAAYQGGAVAARAGDAGCRLASGRDWLLHQGLAAWSLMTSREAPSQAMTAALATARLPDRARDLCLVGFPGSGKSTVARILAARLGRELVDTDDLVCSLAGCPVEELIRQQGVARFRALESRALELAARPGPRVVATGGGLVLEPSNRELLRTRFTTIWLYAAPELCLSRVAPETRPLLSRDPAQARQLLEDRFSSYAAAADLVVDASGPADLVAREILSETA